MTSTWTLRCFLALALCATVLSHAGVRMPSVRKEKMAKNRDHLPSVSQRPRGACGIEFMAECDIGKKYHDWKQHPCFLSEKDGVPVRIKRGGKLCLKADHGGHINDRTGRFRNDGMTNGIQVSMHGSECPSLAQFNKYIIAEAPYEISTTEPGLPVTIPSEVAQGKYTVLWHWAWPPGHQFTSCHDIIVDDINGEDVVGECDGPDWKPKQKLTKKPCPRGPELPNKYTCDTVQREDENQATCSGWTLEQLKTTLPPPTPQPTCGTDYCLTLSTSSWCKGNGYCHGFSKKCTCDDNDDDSSDDDNGNGGSSGATCGNAFCQAKNPASYCKSPGVCHGSGESCACSSTGKPDTSKCGDELCQSIDATSYCKTWKTPSVCHGNDTPCGTCPPQGRASCGDAMCKSLNKNSYCRTSQKIPTCFGTKTPCACSTSGNVNANPPASDLAAGIAMHEEGDMVWGDDVDVELRMLGDPDTVVEATPSRMEFDITLLGAISNTLDVDVNRLQVTKIVGGPVSVTRRSDVDGLVVNLQISGSVDEPESSYEYGKMMKEHAEDESSALRSALPSLRAARVLTTQTEETTVPTPEDSNNETDSNTEGAGTALAVAISAVAVAAVAIGIAVVAAGIAIRARKTQAMTTLSDSEL